jgi:hypothetical protein
VLARTCTYAKGHVLPVRTCRRRGSIANLLVVASLLQRSTMKLPDRAYGANKFPRRFLASQIKFLLLVKDVAGCYGHAYMWDGIEIRGTWSQKAACSVHRSAQGTSLSRLPLLAPIDRAITSSLGGISEDSRMIAPKMDGMAVHSSQRSTYREAEH